MNYNSNNKYRYRIGLACSVNSFSIVSKNSIADAFNQARGMSKELEFVEIEEVYPTRPIYNKQLCSETSTGKIRIILKGLICENCN